MGKQFDEAFEVYRVAHIKYVKHDGFLRDPCESPEFLLFEACPKCNHVQMARSPENMHAYEDVMIDRFKYDYDSCQSHDSWQHVLEWAAENPE